MLSPPIIDGHNDVLLRLWQRRPETAVTDFLGGDGEGHIDLPRLKAGGFAGGFFAIFAPSDETRPADDDELNPPAARRLSRETALKSTSGMVQLLHDIVAASSGGVVICKAAKDISAAMAQDQLATILHIEGAEAIAADLSGLQEFYEKGLRSLGPVWSRSNVFGHGVPFRFPSSPDTGPGLTDAGKALVHECNRLRILVDLSHLNERGFWDVAKISAAPLVATHSNAHGLCASSRNLTDDQLRAIGESGGMVGLNFANGFLRADGRWNMSAEPAALIKHLEHMLRVAGEDNVGLGSDFDGCRLPTFINDASGLPRLIEAMREAGFGSERIAKIAYRNWLRVLDKTWGA